MGKLKTLIIFKSLNLSIQVKGRLVFDGIVGNNKVSVQLEIFFRWNPSGTFRNIP